MGGWWLVPVAYFSMCCQDILSTVLVQAESDERAHLAAAMDTLQDVFYLASFYAVGDSLLLGGFRLLAVSVIGARLGADYSGTYAGVKIGGWIRRRVHARAVER
jgi:hypothetical protein